MKVFGRAAMLPTERLTARFGVTMRSYQRSRSFSRTSAYRICAGTPVGLAGLPAPGHIVAPVGFVRTAEGAWGTHSR